MNKKLSERLAMLEEMGFDTSKYNVVIKNNTVEIEGIERYVDDVQIKNDKVFRRWITAQTFKMLDYGWDKYLRDNYSYMYQFTMMLEEIKTLYKLEIKDIEEFQERTHFFNQYVVVKTCNHYMNQFKKYVKANWNERKGHVKLSAYGYCDEDDLRIIFNNLKSIIIDIRASENYAELYSNLKKFVAIMNKLPNDTPKCPVWKAAFRGNGGYYTLKNLILFHRVVLRGCTDKKSSMNRLEAMLDEFLGEDVYKFNAVLKDTIEYNDFDLKEFKRKYSKNK